MVLFIDHWLRFSLTKIETVDIYVEPEGLYGEKVIFRGILPVYLFSFLTNECGDFLNGIDFYRTKYNLDTYKFIGNILKESSDLTIEPVLKGIMMYYRKTNNTKDFALEMLNIDPYWTTLNEKQIKRIIRRSKIRFNNF